MAGFVPVIGSITYMIQSMDPGLRPSPPGPPGPPPPPGQAYLDLRVKSFKRQGQMSNWEMWNKVQLCTHIEVILLPEIN